jgi:hypothetical protein
MKSGGPREDSLVYEKLGYNYETGQLITVRRFIDLLS